MGQLKKIEPRTEEFIEALELLKANNEMPTTEELMTIFGTKNQSAISEVKAKRSNIQPKAWEAFKSRYGSRIFELSSKILENTKPDESRPVDTKQENNRHIDDYEKKYITLLEETVRQQREEINALHQDIKKVVVGIEELKSVRAIADENKANLARNHKDLGTVLDLQNALIEALSVF